MPGGDRTGPIGMGPMTGRAAGFCGGYGSPGYANAAFGRDFGMGYGRGRGYLGHGGGGGRGWRHWYYATGVPGWARFGGYGAPYGFAAAGFPADPDTEKRALSNQAEALQQELDQIRKRLADLESGKAEE